MGDSSFQFVSPKHTASTGGMMFPMSDGQFQLVYNILSFSLASMMATTLFLWMRVPQINAKYQTALIISGLVTFIAAYHYMRIFNSWRRTVLCCLLERCLRQAWSACCVFRRSLGWPFEAGF